MIILELSIRAFGTLKDKKISLRPGMNVITGDNGSGKTTVASFLAAMLYGLYEEDPEYARWFPKAAESVYGGSVKVLADGAFYIIDRDFTAEGNALCITRVSDGQRIDQPEDWLKSVTGSVSREDYMNSGFISQGVLLKDVERYAVTEEKKAAEEKEEAIRREYEQAARSLKERRAGFAAGIREELDELISAADSEYAEKDASLKSLLAALPGKEQALSKATESLGKDEERVKKENSDRNELLKEEVRKAKSELELSVTKAAKNGKGVKILGTVALLLGLILSAVTFFYMKSEKLDFSADILKLDTNERIIAFIGGAAAAVFLLLGLIFAILSGVRHGKARRHEKRQKALRETAEAKEAAYQNYLDNKDTLEAHVDHKEERTENIRTMTKEIEADRENKAALEEELKKLSETKASYQEEFTRRAAFRKEVQAIDLALSSFEALAAVKEDAGVPAGKLAGEYLKRIDTRTEAIVLLSEEGILYLKSGDKKTPVEELTPSEAAEAILALRLSLLQEKDPEKKLPVVLDDAFAGFDENRMNAAMNLLRSLGRQAIVLSCQTREKSRLQE